MLMNAYSRLKRILQQQKISIPELHRRILSRGLQINIKSLYRLSDENQPIERLDLRVAGAICQACAVPLSAWIVFDQEDGKLRKLTSDQQERLELLMSRNNAGQLTDAERNELQALVHAAEEITLANARLLAAHRPPLAGSPSGDGGGAS
jgi:hypothetical protein